MHNVMAIEKWHCTCLYWFSISLQGLHAAHLILLALFVATFILQVRRDTWGKKGSPELSVSLEHRASKASKLRFASRAILSIGQLHVHNGYCLFGIKKTNKKTIKEHLHSAHLCQGMCNIDSHPDPDLCVPQQRFS